MAGTLLHVGVVALHLHSNAVMLVPKPQTAIVRRHGDSCNV